MKDYLRFFRRSVALPILLLICQSLHAESSTSDWNLAVLNQILAGVQPRQTLVQVGDMQILVANLTAARDQLSGNPSPQSAFDGIAPTWTSGNVYYNFSTSGSNAVPANLQKAFTDAAAEWATFANLHFILRTTQANYITVQINNGGEGGQSAVGMVGGQQFLSVSADAWNRGTICHEIGHALGLVHEHQRSDRDSFVTVLSNNIPTGELGNFVLLANSRNETPYDFLSVMHYSRNEDPINPAADTLEPLPAYAKYLNIMGVPGPVTLSTNDRAGMALIYGAGPGISPVVTNTQDSGPRSLRMALYYAYDHPNTRVTFNIPTNDPGYSNGVFTIQPSDQLPWLVNATFLDGSSQPTNSASNTNGPVIQINGALVPIPGTPADGLFFAGTNCTVHKLVINGFNAYGIEISGSNTFGNVVSGCYLGINPSGTAAVTNTICPLTIDNGAISNTIGGLSTTNRNIICGSAFQGITIHDAGTRYNVVEGDYFGINARLAFILGNALAGVEIYSGAQSNLIESSTFSGNRQGVLISGTNTIGNIVAGNYFGVNLFGVSLAPNGIGVNIAAGASGNHIGLATGAGNVISGSTAHGILIQDSSFANVVQNNKIGLNPIGTLAISNGGAGIELASGPQSNIIGGTTSSARNIISGNGIQGILIHYPGTSANVIEGNYIGTDYTGMAAIPNGAAGIEMGAGAQFNVIGGTVPGAGNVISGNNVQGIYINYTVTVSNLVQGNIIGLNATGNAAIPNQVFGIEVSSGPQFNTIGGTVPGAGNVLSGNIGDGIRIDFTGSQNNLVQGNFVGLNLAGTAAIPNTYAGIEIYGGANHNLIGGLGGRNYVCGNSVYGVVIDFSCTNNFVQGNTIGLSPTGIVVPNATGVVIYSGGVSNIIGGLNPGNANLIVSNNSSGVALYDSASTNNTVVENSIYGNNGVGISLNTGANAPVAVPLLMKASMTTNITVTGVLTSIIHGVYRLDFYADPATANPPQGKIYLGSQTFNGQNLSQGFSLTLSGIVPLGWQITATSTDPLGNTSQQSSNVFVTGTDSQGDGITDAWRAAHFGGAGTTTNSISCATCDPDHDGFSNLQEFYAGTDPNNGASKPFSGTLSQNGADIALNFPTVQGVTYRVEYRDSLSTSGWLLLADQIVGTGGIVQVTDSGVASLPRRFYRVDVLP